MKRWERILLFIRFLSIMNIIFLALTIISFIFAGWRQIRYIPGNGELSPMEMMSQAMVESATGSVELAIGLVGVMALFLGLMKIAEEGGMLTFLARLIRPLMVRLFPDVPPDHPAMGAMILNLSANALGLGNAATPFGIKAMQELDKLNENKGTATDSMALFIAINTSSVTLLPTGVIALRASAGSSDPAGILPTTLFATICSTLIAILAAKTYKRFFPIIKPEIKKIRDNAIEKIKLESEASDLQTDNSAYPLWISIIALLLIISFLPIAVFFGRSISPWIIPGLMVTFLSFGIIRRVKIYETFIEGAKEGFNVALKIIPYLVAILVAVGMFRASGAMGAITGFLGKWTSGLHLPPEALPMALLRPLSGSGAYGILASVINNPATGPDTYTGYLVSTFQGSTETTFYVLAVYFGAVQIRKIRHALVSAITADIAGIIFAVIACMYLFG